MRDRLPSVGVSEPKGTLLDYDVLNFQGLAANLEMRVAENNKAREGTVAKHEREMPLAQRRVLVVDDSRTIRLVTKDFLRSVGFTEVAEAGDAEEALLVFHGFKPEIVFLDLQIPKGQGKEVARQILEADPYTKIIVVSAEAPDSKIGKSILRLGAYEYLRKPLKEGDLLRVIERMRRELNGSIEAGIPIPAHTAPGTILLEYSPGVNPNKMARFFRQLLLEFERVHLFTSPRSPLHEAITGERNVELHLLSSSGGTDDKWRGNEVIPIRDPSLIADAFYSTVEGLGEERVLIVFDSLTDSILQVGFESAYLLLKQVLNMLATYKVTVLFILNVLAHEGRQVAAIRGVIPRRVNLEESLLVGDP